MYISFFPGLTGKAFVNFNFNIKTHIFQYKSIRGGKSGLSRAGAQRPRAGRFFSLPEGLRRALDRCDTPTPILPHPRGGR